MTYFTRQSAVKAAFHREANGRFAAASEGKSFADGASHYKHVTLTTGRVGDGARPDLPPPIPDGTVLTAVDAASE
jgi:hypothetical protein